MSAGVFGYLGYDMVRQMERLPPAKPDPIGVPEALLIRPTVMVVFDSVRDEMVVVTPIRPRPASRRARRYEAAEARIDAVVAALEAAARPRAARRRSDARSPTRRSPTRRKPSFWGWSSGRRNISRRRRLSDCAVAAFYRRFDLPAFSLYRALRRVNPSPYLCYPRFRRLPDRRVEPGNSGARARRQSLRSARSPARAGAARRRRRTRRWRTSCWPIRRSAPSI